MSEGYTNRFLRVNLSKGTTSIDDWDTGLARKLIGGAGLAAKIVWDETAANTEPLSAANPLIFMTGPVTATKVPTSGRFIIASLSPLTGIWGESHAGGTWGYTLKRAGFDAIIVTGAAERPVYLWVDGGNAEIRDASHVWGHDTWTTDSEIKSEHGKGVAVACIGRAGEKMVRFASIVGDGKLGRVAARCGLGAVMGSKKLKAIAVRGNESPCIHDETALQRVLQAGYLRKQLDWETEIKPKWQHDMDSTYDTGKRGLKNYRTGDFLPWKSAHATAMLEGDPLYCAGCSASCAESGRVGDKRRMVGQCIDCLGGRLMASDLAVVDQACDLCNRYGMDAMSVGGVLACAMELREYGIISEEDLGCDLRWGSGEAELEMIRKIGEREGLGDQLAEGVKRFSQRIGGLAPEYAMQIKGSELPNQDVRAWNAGALEWATASSGPQHMESRTPRIAGLGDFFDDEARAIARNRFSVEGTGRVVAMAQNFGNLEDSLVVCKMLNNGLTRTGQIVRPCEMLEWLNCVTGWNMEKREFLKAGERIFNLKRMINVRRGTSRKDDTLPARLLTCKRGAGTGGAADNLPPLGTMLNEYYASRGWNEDGIPTRAKLNELDLGETVNLGR